MISIIIMKLLFLFSLCFPSSNHKKWSESNVSFCNISKNISTENGKKNTHTIILLINHSREGKFSNVKQPSTIPISPLYSFVIISAITSCNVLPICLIQLSVIYKTTNDYNIIKWLAKTEPKMIIWDMKARTFCSCRFFSCANKGILETECSEICKEKTSKGNE